MSTPTMTTTHRTPTHKIALARASSAATLLGALLLLPIALLHPEGNDAEAVNSLSSWTILHLLGAFGVALIAVGAALRLVLGPANVCTAAGFAAMAVFGTILSLLLAMEGFTNPYFAERPDLATTPLNAIRDVTLEVERAAATLGFGGFGLAGALISLSQLGTGPIYMRIGRAVAALGFLAVAGAGILYIGMDNDGLGAFFIGMPVVAVWLVVAGILGLARPGLAMGGAQKR